LVTDPNNPWLLEEDDTQLTNPWQLSPEKFESIDDQISYLTSVTKNRQEARSYVSGKVANEQGTGNLETDLGYVQCQPPRKDLIDLIHIMKKVRTNYKGHVYRDIALVETVIIGYGLEILEGMLTDRGSRIQKEYENWQAGNTPFTIEPYHWQILKPIEKGQADYTTNYYLLNQMYRARIGEIKDEYGLSLGFVVEMCIVEAVRTSKLIPTWLKDNLDKEHEKFSEWLVRKDQIDDIKPKDENKNA
jgi:hypothetical protein